MLNFVAAPPQQPLAYAPKPPWNKRKPLRRLAWLALVCTTAALVWNWRSSLVHRVSLVYWQRQCLSHTNPPDQIGYFVGDIRTVGDMVNADKDYLFRHDTFDKESASAFRTDEAWNKLRELTSPSSSGGGGIFGGGGAPWTPTR